jgi:hypothetical protein
VPGCVLRVGSRSSRVERLVQASGLQPLVIHRKGLPRVPGGTVLSRSSGFNVEVSRADGLLEKQTRDAVRFLRDHSRGLSRVRRCKGFDGMTLDFGVYYLASPERPWPSYRFPASLISLAGKYGIEIELSFYGSGSTVSGERVR